MKRVVVVAVFVLSVAVLAGCRRPAPPANVAQGTPSGGAGTVEIQFWHTQTGANAKALDTLVSRFNAEHTGRIRVAALLQGGYTQLDQKTKAAITAKRPPETAVAYESMVAEYMKAGAVEPLDSYLSGPDGIDAKSLEDIFPRYLDSNRFPQFGNQLLSFPFTKSVLVLYYNQQALKEAGFAAPPKTWDEFEQAAVKTTRRAGGKTTRYGFGVWADASTIDGCILSRGGALLSADNKSVRINEEPGREAFRLVADLVKQGAALRTTRQEYPAEFGNGRIAMFLGSSTAREYVTGAVGGKLPWGCTVIPQKNPSDPVTVQYGANIAVFKTTPEKQRAGWAFVRWLAEPAQTAFWATNSSYMPIRRSVASRPEMQAYWKKDPQAKQCFDVARYGAVEPNIRGWQSTRDALEEAYDKVAGGMSTPEAALAEAAKKANAAIKERQ